MIVADCVPTFERSQEKVEKPRGPIGAFLQFELLWRGGLDFGATRGGCPCRSCPPQNLSLALGALAVHRSVLETPFFQPAEDPMFGEAETRFDPDIRYE